MNFLDTVTLDSDLRKTADGYLVTSALTARSGIQLYLGSEVGIADKAVVKVYRPAEEVFSRDSLATFAHKPMTNDHPSEAVNAQNWKSLSVGIVGDEVARDGEYVRVPLVMMDAKAIADIEGGKRELSAGYTCDLDITAGTTADGEEYDAVQRNIRINHVALVSKGRAGPKARLGDAAGHAWGAIPVTKPFKDERNDPMTKIIMVDGLQVETTDAGAAAIEKLQRDNAKLVADMSTSAAAHAAAISAKDTEIGGLKADLKKAQDAVPAADALDKLVADRATLIEAAKTLDANIVTAGVSDADIRRNAVKKIMGEDGVKDVSDAEVAGMFRALARDNRAGGDPLSGRSPAPQMVGDAQKREEGQQAYEKRLRDAYKTA